MQIGRTVITFSLKPSTKENTTTKQLFLPTQNNQKKINISPQNFNVKTLENAYKKLNLNKNDIKKVNNLNNLNSSPNSNINKNHNHNNNVILNNQIANNFSILSNTMTNISNKNKNTNTQQQVGDFNNNKPVNILEENKAFVELNEEKKKTTIEKTNVQNVQKNHTFDEFKNNKPNSNVGNIISFTINNNNSNGFNTNTNNLPNNNQNTNVIPNLTNELNNFNDQNIENDNENDNDDSSPQQFINDKDDFFN